MTLATRVAFDAVMIDPGRFWYDTALDKLQSKIHTLASTTSTPHGVLMNQEESRLDVPLIPRQVLRFRPDLDLCTHRNAWSAQNWVRARGVDGRGDAGYTYPSGRDTK